LVKIPAGKSVAIRTKYLLPASNFEANSFAYNLKIFKQPGIDRFPYSFSLIFPSAFKIVQNSDGVSEEGNAFQYFGEITTDKNLNIDFTQNK
jgi:hypothetical protein